MFLSYLPMALSLTAIALNAFVLIQARRVRRIRAEAEAKSGISAAGTPDPWIETIRDWLDTQKPVYVLTQRAILDGALRGTPSTRAAQVRITAAMKALGYHATREQLPGRETRVRVFKPSAGTIVVKP